MLVIKQKKVLPIQPDPNMSTRNHLICSLGLFLLPYFSSSQFCPSAQGDQLAYGTNNVWIGYVYDNPDFTNYAGYVTAGTSSNPNITENFGGLYVNLPTNGCSVYTETFSARYKLTKTFPPGTYEFTVSGDDAVRFSINGGASWLINNWTYNSYMPSTVTVALNGTYNMVIEYMEGAHHNRLYFAVSDACVSSGATSAYGTGNIWNGYLYAGVNFDRYKGMVHEGTSSSMAFNQNFGGSSVSFPTNACDVVTDFFSARYRLRQNFAPNSYTLTISADEKYRLSLDGGTTWVIDRWNYDGAYSTRNYVANLNGTYDMVLEYYDKDGDNPLQFSFVRNVVLASELLTFNAIRHRSGIEVSWTLNADGESIQFEVERSRDGGRIFQTIGRIVAPGNKTQHSFIDEEPFAGENYYRLKVIDPQGKITYSKVIMVQQTGSEGIKIFPTIVYDNKITIRNQVQLFEASLLVSDINGRIVFKKQLGKIAPDQTVTTYMGESKPISGIYVVQILDAHKLISNQKIIIR